MGALMVRISLVAVLMTICLTWCPDTSAALIERERDVECTTDEHCQSNEFCNLKTKSCVNCTTNKCSKWQRLPGTSLCPKSQDECGPCLPGYVIENEHCELNTPVKISPDAHDFVEEEKPDDDGEGQEEQLWPKVVGASLIFLLLGILLGVAYWRHHCSNRRNTNIKPEEHVSLRANEASEYAAQLPFNPNLLGTAPSEELNYRPVTNVETRFITSGPERQHNHLSRAMAFCSGNFPTTSQVVPNYQDAMYGQGPGEEEQVMLNAPNGDRVDGEAANVVGGNGVAVGANQALAGAPDAAVGPVQAVAAQVPEAGPVQPVVAGGPVHVVVPAGLGPVQVFGAGPVYVLAGQIVPEMEMPEDIRNIYENILGATSVDLGNLDNQFEALRENIQQQQQDNYDPNTNGYGGHPDMDQAFYEFDGNNENQVLVPLAPDQINLAANIAQALDDMNEDAGQQYEEEMPDDPNEEVGEVPNQPQRPGFQSRSVQDMEMPSEDDNEDEEPSRVESLAGRSVSAPNLPSSSGSGCGSAGHGQLPQRSRSTSNDSGNFSTPPTPPQGQPPAGDQGQPDFLFRIYGGVYSRRLDETSFDLNDIEDDDGEEIMED